MREKKFILFAIVGSCLAIGFMYLFWTSPPSTTDESVWGFLTCVALTAVALSFVGYYNKDLRDDIPEERIDRIEKPKEEK